MKAQDNKSFVLFQLSQESAPLSLPDLLKKLPESYAERTVRRWLNELVKAGLVEKLGQKRGTRYQAVKKNIQNAAIIGSYFSSNSKQALDYVKRPLYERQPITYHDQWIESYRPNKSFYFSSHLREQLLKAGQRANGQDTAGSYAHQIFNRLLIDLSYNSSRLEGNTYSLLDTERLILQGISAEGKLDEEKVMIINHKEAIRYLVDHAPRLHIDLQTVCTIHYLLSDGLIDTKYSGKIRDHSVRIGGSTYIPLANFKKLQMHLDLVVKKAALIEDPFEQSLFLLIHLSYLQAFADVNKRTARLSANIPLITKNLVPLSFNDVERGDYHSAMIAVYELQDVRPIIDLYVFSYLRTCVAYDSTAKALGYDRVRVHYRQQRRALIQKIIENRLVGSKLNVFIHSESKKIPGDDRDAFLEDLKEDLDQMDSSRLAGLGLTIEQLNVWLKLYSRFKLK